MNTSSALWVVIVVASLICGSCASSRGPSGGNGTALTATDLRCEYHHNPLGIDVTWPRLTWLLESNDPQVRGQKQSAYQIEVGSAAGAGDLWDSGKVASDETVNIAYGGKPLVSAERCYWRVKVWNGSGAASAWSRPAMWSMGLLEKADWQAQWIGYDTPDADQTHPVEHINLDGAKWVWFNEGNPRESAPAATRYFRKILDLTNQPIRKARFIGTADNSFTLYVNGENVLHGADFKHAYNVDITKKLKRGKNVLAIEATNSTVGPAGLVGRFIISYEGKPGQNMDVDASWLATDQKRDDWMSADADTSNWSPAKEFATIGEAPWGTPEGRKMELPPAKYLRHAFNVNKPVARATAYVSALGLYELHLNGQKVGDLLLAPGWTDFNKRVYYNTYDVTPLLSRGANAVAAELGDGWYNGYLGYSFKRHNYGGEPRLLAQIDIEYKDGSREIVATDSTWKAGYGPLREADLLMGCTYDARREVAGWDSAKFDDSAWGNVVTGQHNANLLVQAHPGEAVRQTAEFHARSMKEPNPGEYVFDLTQNMVGWARFKISGRAGETVTFKYSEMLNPDGTPYLTSLRAARATDSYTFARDGEVTWEPKFTFHGFRYVEITGLSSRPSLDAVTGIVVGSDMRQTGKFACDNKLLNQLFHNIIWGQKGNYLDIPTDCPQRDERLGWTGDAQFFVRTGSYNFDVAAFFTKWLVDLVEDSQMENGGFTHVAPAVSYTEGGGTAWQDAAPVCTYTMYKVYGDTRIIEAHYAHLQRYMQYLHDTSKDLVRNDKPFGDWLNLGGGAKSEVIGTAYYAYVARLMSEMAAAIGKNGDAARYSQLADQIKAKFADEFLTPDGAIKDSSQTGYALAFSMDLIPNDLRAKAAAHFVDEIRKHDWHLATGFIGTPRLLPGLAKAGETDVAYRLLLTDTFPSWLFPVTLGATTMWERWDGWRPDKGFQDPGMNSFNHYAFGSVGQWMYSGVAGIDTDGVGYKKIIIRPVPNERLNDVTGSYESIRGKIISEWRLADGFVHLDATVPVNTTATIYVATSQPQSVIESGKPAGNSRGLKFLREEDGFAVYAAESGRYSFTAKQ
jgi:alpha-L-rhamnosidase